jgi:hypothetical protein
MVRGVVRGGGALHDGREASLMRWITQSAWVSFVSIDGLWELFKSEDGERRDS